MAEADPSDPPKRPPEYAPGKPGAPEVAPGRGGDERPSEPEIPNQMPVPEPDSPHTPEPSGPEVNQPPMST